MTTESQHIAELYSSGLTYKQIKIQLGVSYAKIRKALLQSGIQPRRRGPVASSPHIKEACREAKQLKAAGFTYTEIGERLAVSRQRAQQLCNMESSHVS